MMRRFPWLSDPRISHRMVDVKQGLVLLHPDQIHSEKQPPGGEDSDNVQG